MYILYVVQNEKLIKILIYGTGIRFQSFICGNVFRGLFICIIFMHELEEFLFGFVVLCFY